MMGSNEILFGLEEGKTGSLMICGRSQKGKAISG